MSPAATRVQRVGPVSYVDGPDGSSTLVEEERYPMAGEQEAAGSSLAPMPGSVVRVAVEEGARVEAGQVLVVLEAMKMEHAVKAGAPGTVVRLAVAEGDQVVTGTGARGRRGRRDAGAGPSTGDGGQEETQ